MIWVHRVPYNAFGLTIAPTAFMSVMNKTFQLHLDQFMIIVINEILIYTSNQNEHEKHICVVADFERGIIIC